jgi:diguanylate cyclase (GGDEF)-like protein
MSNNKLMNAILDTLFTHAGVGDSQPADATSIDSMTGLLTKAGLMQAAPKVLSRSLRKPNTYAAISLDMDYFKQINDTVGHAAGDLVLKEVSRRIRTSVRNEDLIARTGGDEFVILMPDIASEIAVLNIADRVLTEVSQPIINESVQLYPSLTVGIAMSCDSSDSSFEEILHRSDLALQQAKMICRGTVHFFDRNMAGELDRRRMIESELRKAVSNGELCLYYQPIYDIKRSIISHVEALVRWQHPELGLVPPDDFIPIAETSGLIQSIGLWVLQRAFNDVNVLNAHGLDDIDIAVNLSPEQLKLASIVSSITEMSASHPHCANRIALEVTEDAVMDERYQMSSKLEDLRQASFKIFLDDFGTGNASIGRLRKFSFDAIKIDRSLITNLDQNPADLAILRSILLLANSLDVTVIAEGVETPSCLNILEQENCRYAQGYYFSRPLPLDETIKVIHERFETSSLATVLQAV